MRRYRHASMFEAALAGPGRRFDEEIEYIVLFTRALSVLDRRAGRSVLN
jgi:hypothetical protein